MHDALRCGRTRGTVHSGPRGGRPRSILDATVTHTKLDHARELSARHPRIRRRSIEVVRIMHVCWCHLASVLHRSCATIAPRGLALRHEQSPKSLLRSAGRSQSVTPHHSHDGVSDERTKTPDVRREWTTSGVTRGRSTHSVESDSDCQTDSADEMDAAAESDANHPIVPCVISVR
jgi:hypothetical protein